MPPPGQGEAVAAAEKEEEEEDPPFELETGYSPLEDNFGLSMQGPGANHGGLDPSAGTQTPETAGSVRNSLSPMLLSLATVALSSNGTMSR